MIRVALATALLLSSAAPAQEPVELTAHQRAERAARAFFADLLAADARAIVRGSALPFHLEDRRFTDRDELLQEWLRQLQPRRVDLHVLYGVEVFTPEEMEAKYGRPPARLGSFPWRAARTFIAVGNLSGRPAVAVFSELRPGDLALVAYHD